MSLRIHESTHECRGAAVRGVVKGRWAGNTHALIELNDGRLVEARGPWNIVGRIALGQDVTVFFDGAGHVAGWTPE
jgi:hypothetical protein